MIIHDERNRMLASITGAPEAPKHEEPSDEVHLAGEFKRALDSGDPQAIADAFRALTMCCNQPYAE